MQIAWALIFVYITTSVNAIINFFAVVEVKVETRNYKSATESAQLTEPKQSNFGTFHSLGMYTYSKIKNTHYSTQKYFITTVQDKS